MANPKLTLYIGNTCRFSQRVTDFLKEHPMAVEIKDVWSDEAANQEMLQLTGMSQVPCLRVDNTYMHESMDIIEKLKEIQAKS
jgi:glutathione S-transferase